MKNRTYYQLVGIFTLFNAFLSLGQATTKKVEFVGAARSEMSQLGLSTDATVNDTVTPGKISSGHALIDLGVKITPNSSTEILGMIRINNAFGGFWGSGVTFDVRQLYVRGVVASAFRYQIGNIDYKLSPFTCFNHDADRLIPVTGVQRIKQDIVDYETFHTKNNTWRQQGAAVDFGVNFSTFVESIKFNGFIMRLNPSNLGNVFERFYGGGNMIVTQSKYFSIGINHASAFDLIGSATAANAYRNNVSTVTYQITGATKKWKALLAGETGISSSFYTNTTENSLSDFFIDGKLSIAHKPTKLRADVGYLNVGADFRSIGAQSRRVDFSRQNTVYERYTNDQVVRPLSTYDLFQNNVLYNNSIAPGLAKHNVAYNNVLPYGKATFNRKGVYTSVGFTDSTGIFNAQVDGYFLSEIRGQGTLNLRKFTLVKGTTSVNIHKLLKWKKDVVFTAGAAYQETKRSSDFVFERIQLSSLLYNAGIDFEFADQFHVMLGINSFQVKGNESIADRDENDVVVNFNEIHLNGNERIYSTGIKYDFSDKIFLTAMVDWFDFNYQDTTPYKMNQFMIIYSMKF
jgi:hypothetical protein